MKSNLRLKVVVGEEKEYSIPWSYNYFVASAIYYLLEKYNPKYSFLIHSKGWRYKNKNFKLFTFSPLFPRKIFFKKDYLIMVGPLTFILSSPDSVFIEILENAFKRERMLRFLKYRLPVLKTKMFEVKDIERELMLRTLSPLVVSTKEKRGDRIYSIYLSPDSELFEKRLKEIISEKFECFTGEKLYHTDIDIKCHSFSSKLFSIKNIKVKGYQGVFSIKTDVQVMRFLIDSGLGEKTSMGFGMVEKEED